MFNRLWQDEGGFIISAELVLIATLLVIGLIVGLGEIQQAVVSELNDVADAIGCLNQSYFFSGFSKRSQNGIVKVFTRGGAFVDVYDACDKNQCALSCDPPIGEGPKFGSFGYGGVYGGGYGGGSGAYGASETYGGGEAFGGGGVIGSDGIIGGGDVISGSGVIGGGAVIDTPGTYGAGGGTGGAGDDQGVPPELCLPAN